MVGSISMFISDWLFIVYFIEVKIFTIRTHKLIALNGIN